MIIQFIDYLCNPKINKTTTVVLPGEVAQLVRAQDS